MANHPPAYFGVAEPGSIERTHHPIFWLADKCIHSALTAYVVIAFAISFGFHELSVRSDHRLQSAITQQCKNENELRVEHNTQLEVLVAEFNRKLPNQRRVVSVPYLPFANCRVPKP